MKQQQFAEVTKEEELKLEERRVQQQQAMNQKVRIVPVPIFNEVAKPKKTSFLSALGLKSGKQDVYSRDEWSYILDSYCLLYPQEHYQELARRKAPIQVDKNKLRNSFLEGIPDDLRGSIWKYVSNVHVKRAQYNSDLYYKLLEVDCSEEDELCIGKDLARTISGFKEFKLDPNSGKNRLYTVLKVYSNFDKEVGYCQGINFLAAFFILNMEEDEDAFWCLEDLLCGEHSWRDIFRDDTPRLIELLDRIEEKLRKKCPKVLTHLVTTT
jgi:hypothetical protein